MTAPLTSLSHGAGCGCKLSAADLRPIVAGLPRPADPRVLVAADTADDAGVVQLTPDLAIVQTADFFTPIVDDPYAFGRIAATNALSDIYAMGGRPVSALNLVAYPLETLGPDVLREILRGGADAAAAAGAAVVGGHSIDDPEPKYGMAVTGVVAPDEVLTNAGGRAGDALVLTKPLGAGAVATAIKKGLATDELIERAVTVMTTLNDRAAEQARAAGAHALTDVTGFGLLGHLHELAVRVRARRRGRGRRRARHRARAARGRSLRGRRLAAQPRRRGELHALGRRRAGGPPPPADRRDDLGRAAGRGARRDGRRRIGRLVAGEPGTIAVI